jgi:hypothetical protein
MLLTRDRELHLDVDGMGVRNQDRRQGTQGLNRLESHVDATHSTAGTHTVLVSDVECKSVGRLADSIVAT